MVFLVLTFVIGTINRYSLYIYLANQQFDYDDPDSKQEKSVKHTTRETIEKIKKGIKTISQQKNNENPANVQYYLNQYKEIKEKMVRNFYEMITRQNYKLKLSISFLCYKMCQKKLFKTKKNLLIQQTFKKMEQRLDIAYILTKIQQFEKLKMLFLNTQQIQMFNFSNKEHIEFDEKFDENFYKKQFKEHQQNRRSAYKPMSFVEKLKAHKEHKKQIASQTLFDRNDLKKVQKQINQEDNDHKHQDTRCEFHKKANILYEAYEKIHNTILDTKSQEQQHQEQNFELLLNRKILDLAGIIGSEPHFDHENDKNYNNHQDLDHEKIVIFETNQNKIISDLQSPQSGSAHNLAQHENNLFNKNNFSNGLTKSDVPDQNIRFETHSKDCSDEVISEKMHISGVHRTIYKITSDNKFSNYDATIKNLPSNDISLNLQNIASHNNSQQRLNIKFDNSEENSQYKSNQDNQHNENKSFVLIENGSNQNINICQQNKILDVPKEKIDQIQQIGQISQNSNNNFRLVGMLAKQK